MSAQNDLGMSPEGFPVYLLSEEPGTSKISHPVAAPRKPTPGSSLTASATRLRGMAISRLGNRLRSSGDRDWQQDAWDIFDVVGEQRFLATTLAGRAAQARLYVGTTDPRTPEKPEQVEDEALSKLLADLGGGSYARLAQHVYRFVVNLFVAGEIWFVGIPNRLLEEVPSMPDNTISPLLGFEIDPATKLRVGDTMEDLTWTPLSISEFRHTSERVVQITLEDERVIEASVDELYFTRIWRPHPNKSWQADSPTRSSLPVLRELVGLTQHISAQIDSRLAGAGILVVPASVVKAMKAQQGLDEDDPDEDPFTDALIEAMTTPITDRDSASAIVPLVVTVPDELTDSIKHVSFSSPIDAESKGLREEAINRLAIGQDAPPELLLGTGGMNHWGAWLVREDVVTTHLEPPLALICDALTSQYLHPLMASLGYPEDQIKSTVIWYDIDHLIVQPTRVEDAERMHDKGLIDDKTMRDIAGFDDTNAPEIREVDQAVELALDLIRQAPTLVSSPGLPALVAQIRATLDGEDATTIETSDLEAMGGDGDPSNASPASTPESTPSTEGRPPATDGTAGPFEPAGD